MASRYCPSLQVRCRPAPPTGPAGNLCRSHLAYLCTCTCAMLCVNPYARPARQPVYLVVHDKETLAARVSVPLPWLHPRREQKNSLHRSGKKKPLRCASFPCAGPRSPSLCHEWVRNARQTFETNRCRCSIRNMVFNKSCRGLDPAHGRLLACCLCPLETALVPFARSNRLTVRDSTQVVEKIKR